MRRRWLAWRAGVYVRKCDRHHARWVRKERRKARKQYQWGEAVKAYRASHGG